MQIDKYMYHEKANQQEPEEVEERWRESLEVTKITKKENEQMFERPGNGILKSAAAGPVFTIISIYIFC